MSVVTSVRDYIEILNTQIGPQDDSLSLLSLVSKSFPHFLQLCKETFWYVISFQAFHDNFYQPYLSTIDKNFITNLIESSIFGSLGSGYLISLLKPHTTNLSLFLSGFGNSFFISIPGSIGTLLILRRVILQGIPAGIAATIGSIIGSCFSLIFVTCGCTFIVLNPAFLDLFFFLGILIPGYVILRSLCFSDFRLISAKENFSLFSIGFLHFLLSTSNQSTLFRHLRDLTINPNPTRFLGLQGLTGIFYILGYILGSIIFAFSAFYGVVFFINWLLARSTLHRSRLMKLCENTSIVFLTAYSISTFSYYGTDFLLGKSFGFLPFDKEFSETVLAPNTIFKDPHTFTGVHALYPSNEFSLDPGPFDRPLDKLFRRSILLKQPYFKYRSFEELNYQGEKHWLHRGFRHGSAKPIKTVTLPIEKNKLAKGRALLRSLDKAIGWVDENQNSLERPQMTFTNLAKENIDFDFPTSFVKQNTIDGNSQNKEYDFSFLEQKFKRYFFGQIGLLPGRLPPPSGPFDSQEMAHKRLAFANPVYKALLSFDIDLFLKRQPPNQSLSTEDEHNLFLKRQLLERYINTQRDYFDQSSKNNVITADVQNPRENYESFTKSLANQTYKHQFKGTLEIVRQMFAVSLDCPEPSSVAGGGLWEKLHPSSRTAPKNSASDNRTDFDQEGPLGKNFFIDDRGLTISRPLNPRILKFDQPLYNVSKEQNKKEALEKSFLPFSKKAKPQPDLLTTFDHEELYSQKKNRFSFLIYKKKQKSFLESSVNSPLYVGWDNERRKLLLTRRYLTRKDALIFNSSFSEMPKGQKKQIHVTTSANLSSTPDQNSSFRDFDHGSNIPVLKKKNVKGFASEGDSSLFDELNEQKGSSPVDRRAKGTDIVEPHQSRADIPYLQPSRETFFASWPLSNIDPTDKASTNWRIPSRSFEHMVSLEEDARVGDEPSDKNKGIRGSYEGFVELWKNKFLQDLPHQTQSFKLNRWPTNITTPSVQADLDSFDQIEHSFFTGIKRGGFIWPGDSEKNFSRFDTRKE